MKNVLFYLILSVQGFTSQWSAAQGLLDASPGGELPPEAQVYERGAPNSLSDLSLVPPEAEELPSQKLEDLQSPLSMGDLGNTLDEGVQGNYLRAFDCDPALLESSGTWLQRGFWFAEADAVLFSKKFDTRSRLLIQDVIPNPNPNLPDAIIGDKNILTISGTKPGVEGVPRLKVGRFLFRDHSNRDHTMEFTAFGGGNWNQERRLDGNFLAVPFQISGNNNSFNGATSSQFNYDSRFNSFELNYQLKQRMLKDRMELEPNGQWVRRAQISKMNSFLAGARYFNLEENLNWSAFGIPDNNNDSDNETGSYLVDVGNDLIGTQIGAASTWQAARWSVTGQLKGGLYLNMQTLDSSFDISNTASGETSLEGDNLAWIGEAALIGRWHIRQNFSLRASLEVLHLAGVAIAPDQIDFIPSGSTSIGMNSDLVYLGGAIGVESYW